MQVALALIHAAEGAITDAIRTANEDGEEADWVKFEAATAGLRRYALLGYDAEALVAGADEWRAVVTTEEVNRRASMHRVRIEAEASSRLAGIAHLQDERDPAGSSGMPAGAASHRVRLEAFGAPPMPSMPPAHPAAGAISPSWSLDELPGEESGRYGVLVVAVGAAQAELLLPVAGALARQGADVRVSAHLPLPRVRIW